MSSDSFLPMVLPTLIVFGQIAMDRHFVPGGMGFSIQQTIS